MKRLFMALFTCALSFCFINDAKAVYTDSNVGTYEQELAKFPCDYQTKIKELHKTYPNAIFVAQKTFFDWKLKKEVSVKWSDMLEAEMWYSISDSKVEAKSVISPSANASYRTTICQQKSGSSCSWYVASETGVKYYLNPYNFLDTTHIFMFESQFYSDYQTESGVEKILSGTFMANKNCPGSSKTYAQVIMEAAKKYNVSPYMLASRLKQEQGSAGTSQLISGTYTGYKGYYNYFNIQASGSTDKEVIENGLKCANGSLVNKNGKKVCDGNLWTTPYLSILGGSKFIREEYVGVNDTYNVKGQMTYYLQKWDPYGAIYAGHQYMQNIQAPYSESSITYTSYSSFNGYKNYKYVFYIPIFTSAPNTTSTSCQTTSSYKVSGSYISGIPLGTTGNTVASKTNGTVKDSSGKSKTSGKIATGDKVTVNGNTYTVVVYGDVNGDGEIKSTDYIQIKNHIMGTKKLTGAALAAADANKDGSVKATDYVKIKNHIMGTNKITQ